MSSVKQIAGRAGRFGLHGSDENSGGTVTTLHAEDLPYVKKCVAQPYEPLPCAYIGHTHALFTAVGQVLPKDVPMSIVLEAPSFAGRLPSVLRYNNNSYKNEACQYIGSACNFDIEERLLLLNAPIPWRDPAASTAIKRMLRMHGEEMSVKVVALSRTPFFSALLSEEKKMSKKQITSSPQSLLDLEYLHKIVSFYLWMHHRFPAVYAEYIAASELKSRVEKVLTWCLENLSAKVAKKSKYQHLRSPQSTRPALSYMTKTELRKISLLRTGSSF